MKSILVNYLGRKGAGPVFSYEMTKGLINNGASVCAILPKSIDNLEDWKNLSLRKLVLIDTYNNNLSFLLGVIRFLLIDKHTIKKELSSENIECIYIPMLQPWSELINRLFPKAKLVSTLHDPIPHSGSSKLLNYIYSRTVNRSDKLIILSEVFKESTCKYYHKNPSQVHVIPHGIFDYYSNFNPPIIERDSHTNFLFFGRITQYKGLHVLSAAYKKVHMEYPDTSLYVVGNGDFSEYSDEFPATDDITVINRFIDDSEVVSFFRGERIITVLPYIDATQSGIIPIAMKEKSLLIVSNKGGLAEQTCNGKYAILTEPTGEALYEKMKEAIENYDKYSITLDGAKNYIESLTWDKLSTKLLEVIYKD